MDRGTNLRPGFCPLFAKSCSGGSAWPVTTNPSIYRQDNLFSSLYPLTPRMFWAPRPYLRFVGAGSQNSSRRTARKDWENCDLYGTNDHATRGWFKTNLPALIEKYSPRHVTRRELLELIRIRDKDLLHVCNALICDLKNAGRDQSLHELNYRTLWSQDGADFYFDEESGTAVKAAQVEVPDEPDYAGGVQMPRAR
jgi:hypothetical protein